jgi:lipoyl(octanoyl) transferase
MLHSSKKYQLKDLGSSDYKECWDYQEELFANNVRLKAKDETRLSTENYLILTEHQPVYTLGKRGNFDNLIVNEKLLGADFYKINRGGDITYHGPGQLVVYPILDLEKYEIGLAQYIWNMEEIVIQLIAKYGLKGDRNKGASGVWLDIENPFKIRKICAVGVRASRHITMHGIAFNVDTDLSFFEKIIPCGIANAGVTSLSKELGKTFSVIDIKNEFIELFDKIFEVK